jgi:CheY-specific phosphatase CheX
LIARIDALGGGEEPSCYRLDELGDRAESTASTDGYAGVIRKSYVATTFASDVAELVLGVPRTAEGLKPWAEFLERELKTALYQTLSMMTGIEPEPIDEMPSDRHPQICGRLGIRADSEMFQLVVGVDTTDDMALQLAKAMLGDDIDEKFAIDGFKEVLNVVAGRHRTACVERKVDILMQMPEVFREEPTSEGVAAYRIDAVYSWNSENIRIFLEVNELRQANGQTVSEEESVTAA